MSKIFGIDLPAKISVENLRRAEAQLIINKQKTK